MIRASRIVCQCGGELPRPLPPACPHCGGVIASVRQRRWPAVVGVLWVLALFGVLAAFLWWLVR